MDNTDDLRENRELWILYEKKKELLQGESDIYLYNLIHKQLDKLDPFYILTPNDYLTSRATIMACQTLLGMYDGSKDFS